MSPPPPQPKYYKAEKVRTASPDLFKCLFSRNKKMSVRIRLFYQKIVSLLR